MIFSRTRILFLLVAVSALARIEAKEDPVDLLRRHRYDEAIMTWDQDLAPSGKQDEKGLRALKGKSLAYSRLGSLYGTYSGFANAIMAEYYASLLESGANAIHYAYLGQIQYQAGKYAEAKASFEKAHKLGGGPQGILDLNEVFLHYTRKRLGENPGESPLVKDNGAQWQALELKGGDPAQGPAGSSQRGRRCRLSLLIRAANPDVGEIEASLRAVLNDAQQPETYLDEGKNTQINFYDPFLMQTLSDSYYALSKLTNLRIKEEESRFPDLAAKFNTDQALAEAYIRLGQYREAAGLLPKDSPDIDTQLLKAQVLAKTGKADQARALMESLANGTKSAADRRDIADCYYLLGLDLDKGLKLAGLAVKDKNGPNYYRTYANLLFAAGQTESAMQQYAKGYKIEYRNRIDQIDPEYMSDYAFAIFKTNKLRYEEIVETLYHLQKEFPACRQMHYCMQGISAGLARSYESQRIFRKGG
jgi:tetratricopeptide (TPR) repeat protein